MEVQRHGNPVPISIPHKALENADLLNYKIPKVHYIKYIYKLQ